MSGLKAIRRRIQSVKSTRQITRAMKLVSAAKLKRAQDAALASRQFRIETQRAFVLAILNLPEDYSHPILTRLDSEGKTGVKVKQPKTKVYAVSGERGLCGAFNTNLTKAVQNGENISECEIIAIGKKANSAAARFKWTLAGSFEGLPDDVALWPIEEIVDAGFKEFQPGTNVKLYFTQFVSALTQRVTVETLLPFDLEKMMSQVNLGQEVAVKLDPSAVKVFEYLAPIYLRARLREAALESRASEHAARMTAMDSATNNASDLIEELQLFYNRARQSAITRELIDIIGGSSV